MSLYSAISWRQVDEKNKEVEDVAKRRDHDWLILTPRHFTASEKNVFAGVPFPFTMISLQFSCPLSDFHAGLGINKIQDSVYLPF